MSVFEVLASNDQSAADAQRRAEIAAQERAKARFGSFLANAGDDKEFESRRFLVEDEVRAIGQAVAAEYGGDAELAITAANEALEAHVLAAHDADCKCGFCANKGKLPGAKKDEDKDDGKSDEKKDGNPFAEKGKDDDDEDDKKESAVKTACSCEDGCDCGGCGADCEHSKKTARWSVVAAGATLEDVDHYQTERVDVQGTEGPVPKIDKSKSGDVDGWTTEPIDVGSVRHRNVGQDAEGIDHWKAEQPEGEDGPVVLVNKDINADPFADSGPLLKSVDADSPIGSEETGTADSWSGTERQADPVTSRYHIIATED